MRNRDDSSASIAKSVLVASLHGGNSDKTRNVYYDERVEVTGELVCVHRLSHEEKQNFGEVNHAQQEGPGEDLFAELERWVDHKPVLDLCVRGAVTRRSEDVPARAFGAWRWSLLPLPSGDELRCKVGLKLFNRILAFDK